MSKSSEGATGDFVADLAAVRQDVARLVDAMSNLVQHQAKAAGSHVTDAVGDAGHAIASKAADAQAGVRAALGDVEGRIERNPLTAMLIAFGVGMSIGIVSRSRG